MPETEKHTPGPWTYEKATASHETWHVRSKKQGCIVALQGRTAQANAMLIAAAPDSLEAAKKLIEYEDLLEAEDDVSAMLAYAEAVKLARKAIAKAEGKK